MPTEIPVPVQPSDEELRRRYFYHRPTDESARRHQVVNATCLELAKLLRDLVPAGREASIAQTKLEEVARWANSGIARAYGEPEPRGG